MFRPYLKRSLTCLVRCRVGSTLPYGGIQTKVCGDQNSVSRRPHGRKKRRGVKCELGQFIQGFVLQTRNYFLMLLCLIPGKIWYSRINYVPLWQRFNGIPTISQLFRGFRGKTQKSWLLFQKNREIVGRRKFCHSNYKTSKCRSGKK